MAKTTKTEETPSPLSQASETEQRTQPMTIEDALAALDPDNDEHWNQDGSPKVAVVESLVGDRSITKADIDKAGAGFNRAAAREMRDADALTSDAGEMAAGVIREPGTNGDAPELADRVAKVEPPRGHLLMVGATVRALGREMDEAWTGEGLPDPAFVSTALAGASVTAEDIAAAAPGFTREMARSASDPLFPPDADGMSSPERLLWNELHALKMDVVRLQLDLAFLRAQFGWPTKG